MSCKHGGHNQPIVWISDQPRLRCNFWIVSPINVTMLPTKVWTFFFQTENVLEHQVTSRNFKHQTWRNNRLRRTEHFPSRVERSNSCILAESPTAMIPVREMTIHYGNRWKYDISQLTDYVCMNKLENWWPSSFTQNFGKHQFSPTDTRKKCVGSHWGPFGPGGKCWYAALMECMGIGCSNTSDLRGSKHGPNSSTSWTKR